MSTENNYCISGLFTREGREIFRLKKVCRDGISGEFECIYSSSAIYEEGEVETNLLSRYDPITIEKYPNLLVVIMANDFHLRLSHEALVEVIRQSYVIGVKDGVRRGEQEPRDVLRRCSYIYKDINQQALNGPLKLHKYDLELLEPKINPDFLKNIYPPVEEIQFRVRVGLPPLE